MHNLSPAIQDGGTLFYNGIPCVPFLNMNEKSILNYIGRYLLWEVLNFWFLMRISFHIACS